MTFRAHQGRLDYLKDSWRKSVKAVILLTRNPPKGGPFKQA
jgi:hypothetical protein